MALEFLLSRITVKLNQGQGHSDDHPNVDMCRIYHHTEFEPNRCVNVLCMPTFFFFFWGGGGGGGGLDAVNTTAAISIDYTNLTKNGIRKFNFLIAWITSPNMYLNPLKREGKNIKPTGFGLCWPCDAQPNQGRWKFYFMTVVNGASKLGIYERIWLKSLRVVSSAKVSATQNRKTVGCPNTTKHLDPHTCSTHMNQNRRVNAQTIYSHQTYRTASQPPPLNIQIFELLHATLQHNDCTRSTFYSDWNQSVEFSSV